MLYTKIIISIYRIYYMCVCICMYMYVCICTYVYVCICMYVCMYKHTHIHTEYFILSDSYEEKKYFKENRFRRKSYDVKRNK